MDNFRYVFFIFCISLPIIATSAPGDLDITFNPPNGFVLYNNGNYEWGSGVAIQSDGKIVITGGSWNGTDFDVLILRYNIDGVIDSTFGVGGVVFYNSGYSDSAHAIAIQQNGKIVVAGGRYNEIGDDWDVLVIRDCL